MLAAVISRSATASRGTVKRNATPSALKSSCTITAPACASRDFNSGSSAKPQAHATVARSTISARGPLRRQLAAQPP